MAEKTIAWLKDLSNSSFANLRSEVQHKVARAHFVRKRGVNE